MGRTSKGDPKRAVSQDSDYGPEHTSGNCAGDVRVEAAISRIQPTLPVIEPNEYTMTGFTKKRECIPVR